MIFSSEQSYSGLVIPDYGKKTSFHASDKLNVHVVPLRLESYPTDGRTDTRIEGGKTLPRN